jgi:hypothetical protein
MFSHQTATKILEKSEGLVKSAHLEQGFYSLQDHSLQNPC